MTKDDDDLTRSDPPADLEAGDHAAKIPVTPAAARTDDERVAAFHQHLDACAQCRAHPFDLCPTGAQLLRETP